MHRSDVPANKQRNINLYQEMSAGMTSKNTKRQTYKQTKKQRKTYQEISTHASAGMTSLERNHRQVKRSIDLNIRDGIDHDKDTYHDKRS